MEAEEGEDDPLRDKEISPKSREESEEIEEEEFLMEIMDILFLS